MITVVHTKRRLSRLGTATKLAEKRFVRSVEAVKPTPEVLAVLEQSTARARKARNAAFLDKYRVTA